MKIHKTEILISLVVALIAAWLVPNVLEWNSGLVMPEASKFAGWFFLVFALCLGLFYSITSKEKVRVIADGYHEFFNENNQLTKKGVFSRGQLVDGSKYIYKKSGTLKRTEIYKNGVCVNKVPVF
jgi:hypothetical protein